MKKEWVVIVVVFVLVLLLGFYFLNNVGSEPVGCQEDARVCNDGITTVVRNASLNCRFNPCPANNSVEDDVVVDNSSVVVGDMDGIICEFDAYNCGNFSSQAEAQAVFDNCGLDIHRLDNDGDDVACEGLN